jgi:two-component system, OmpR family, sensor histidine kinase MprB
MTLRARLALSLAVLAAFSVVIVSVASYVATDRRLHDDVDAALVGYATRLSDPDGRSAHMLCDTLSQSRVFPNGSSFQEFGGVLAGLPDGALECVSTSGHVLAWTGAVELTVDDSTRRAATRYPSSENERGTPLAPSTTSGGLTPAPSIPQPGPATTTTTARIAVSSPRSVTVDERPYRLVVVSVPGGGAIQIARSLDNTNNVLGSIRDLALGVGVAVIALAALAGWVIARRTTRPVLRLTDAAEAVGATGQLKIPVPPGGKDEVGRLARAFGSMLDALNRSRTQQQRLVQDAGHELRTPLTSLRANIDTLRRHPDLVGPSRQHLLDDLDSELRELSGMVDELVALAVDRYDDEPERTVAVGELAARAAERAERRTGRAVTVDAEPATTFARPGQLLRAITNLVDNAAKFSPEGTPIEIVVRPGRLDVRDHGPGIAAGDLPYVFDRFYRAVDVRSLPGSGLGLAIVREAARAAGGDARVANDPGGGAVFTIDFAPASEPTTSA